MTELSSLQQLKKRWQEEAKVIALDQCCTLTLAGRIAGQKYMLETEVSTLTEFLSLMKETEL